jgi:4-amino-4-deoxy-L-arabinose transferase-like glycosyltransferase
VLPKSTTGLGAYSYEAFQPPLAYALDVPIYELSGTFIVKAKLIRLFGVVLLLLTLGLGVRLSRLLLRTNWWFGIAAMGVVAALPGVVVRVATVSNLPLEMVLVMACVTECLYAIVKDRPARLVGAGLLLGLGVLTDLFVIELVPLFIVAIAILTWRRRKNSGELRKASIQSGIGAILGVVVVLPWLVFNEKHYHALTASSIAKKMQIAIVNPTHMHFGIHYLLDLLPSSTFFPVLPEEFNLIGHQISAYADQIISILLIPIAIFLSIATSRKAIHKGLLLGVYLANIIMCLGISFFGQWLSLLTRYTYPTLILLALAGVIGALDVLRSKLLVSVGLLGSVLLVLLIWAPLFSQVKNI